MLDRQQTVATLVLDHSECAQIFQRHGIDFCCRGDLSIEAAAKAKGVDVDALLKELSHAVTDRSTERQGDPRALSTPALVAHIVERHHEYLHKALPFVLALTAKVSRVHGHHNPKLRELDDAVKRLAAVLLSHLEEEERTLFPALVAQQVDRTTLAARLASMVDDHHLQARLLGLIRASCDDFVLPDGACHSYRTLFSELQELERDLFVHVHLENHVLAPRFTVA